MLMQRWAEELSSLKDELTALAGQNATAALSATREKADEAAKLFGDIISDIEEIVAREEENIESFIAKRPLTSITGAFLAGVALGVLLRRK
jgi:ElaB/YqjD/DUF883 family membrane-anchored ribosome-binding protein